MEVQVFGDAAGNVVHLFERECSIQRRYQKIIEEAPSPAVDGDLRRTLGAAAVTAAKAIGYVGAGTVEFVLDGAGAFYFLEVNTRLQVAHPVTEAVTGLDLVELQLRVAGGEPLPAAVLDAAIDGHAVEARLYAEDVAAGFVPAAGPLHRFALAGGEGVRIDAGYAPGTAVGTAYDAMLAKVIAWGPTRAVAVSRLAHALAASRVHGVPTNRELLVAVLRHPEFAAGAIDTGFLDRHPALTAAGLSPSERAAAAVAAALAGQAQRRATATVQPAVPSGWRNVPTDLQRTRFADHRGEMAVGYRLRGAELIVEVDGQLLPDVRLWAASADRVDLAVAGSRRRYQIEIAGDHVYVDGPTGTAEFVRSPRFPAPRSETVPGSLLAPLPGTVARVLVAPGDQVGGGDALVVLEAMKMEHPVRAPWSGTVTEVDVVVGAQVEAGAVLAVMTPDPESP